MIVHFCTAEGVPIVWLKAEKLPLNWTVGAVVLPVAADRLLTLE